MELSLTYNFYTSSEECRGILPVPFLLPLLPLLPLFPLVPLPKTDRVASSHRRRSVRSRDPAFWETGEKGKRGKEEGKVEGK